MTPLDPPRETISTLSRAISRKEASSWKSSGLTWSG
jgi:hypothetical protein